ncbi:MAG: tetratricopeptide repeat protein [Acidobacteriota bacterium]
MDRIAFLTLDNLTGDESFSWLRDAVPAAAGDQLTGVGKIVALRADSTRDAQNLEATRMVHGYFDRRRKSDQALHFEFSIEDVVTHKMETLAVEGDVIAVADRLAKSIDAAAKPFSTANPQAAAAWAKHDYAQATSLDPDFGAAWNSWIKDFASAGKTEEALNTAHLALARPSLRSPTDRVRIELSSAALRKDEAAVTQASAALLKLVPNDAGLLENLAQRESDGRNFAEAVRLRRELLRVNPSNRLIHNMLGYDLFFSGDLAGARKEFDEYAQLSGQEANALDSQGEVLFMAGEFSKAEPYFLKAHEKNPDLAGGGDLLKAVYARWLGGDLKGADQAFEGYLKFRSARADQSLEWRHAVWEYATGREPQARARLATLTGSLGELAKAQIMVWDNLAAVGSDLSMLEQTYRKTPAAADGAIRTLYARALVAAGKREDARKLLQLWPLPESGEPLIQALIYPMFQAARAQVQ